MAVVTTIWLTVATGCAGSGGGTDEASSPSEEALGVRFDEIDELNDRLATRAAEATQSCMLERGFEYSTVGLRTLAYPEGEEPGTTAWVERYGFGASTLAFDQPALGDGLVGARASTGGPESAEYLAGLSESERSAYDVALHGDDMPAPSASQEEIEAYVQSSDGCAPSAQRTVLTQLPLKVLFDEFDAELADMRARLSVDPEMLAWESSITSCLRDAGYDWFGYESTIAEFRTEAQSLASPAQPLNVDLSAFDALRDLQERELELAEAFRGCEQAAGSRSDLVAELRGDYERDFLTANADRLAEAGNTDG